MTKYLDSDIREQAKKRSYNDQQPNLAASKNVQELPLDLRLDRHGDAACAQDDGSDVIEE